MIHDCSPEKSKLSSSRIIPGETESSSNRQKWCWHVGWSNRRDESSRRTSEIDTSGQLSVSHFGFGPEIERPDSSFRDTDFELEWQTSANRSDFRKRIECPFPPSWK